MRRTRPGDKGGDRMAQPDTGEAAPASSAIDRDHLARVTFGDRALECELLRLFSRQAALLLSRMPECEPAAVASLAHTLKGSAAGVGARSVAVAAEALECAAAGSAAECGPALERLTAAVEEARAVIAGILPAL